MWEGLMSAGSLPLGLAAVVPPTAILILCLIAGWGTLLFLPSHRPAALKSLGAVALVGGLIILALLIVHGAAEPSGVGVYFWIFSVIAIGGAIRVITHPRPVYSALYFVMTVFASAGLFVLLSADFVAAALVLIYAGAILVTYLFVIMLAAQATSGPGQPALAGLAEYDLTSREPVAACCVGFAVMGMLIFMIFDKADGMPQPVTPTAAEVAAYPGGTQALGNYLFSHQMVNLELAGLILTLSMVGAIVIARRRIVESPSDLTDVEEVIGPATPINDDPHSIPVFGTRDPAQKAYPET
jgi:NADH-quinone oxidoreductase subunit J